MDVYCSSDSPSDYYSSANFRQNWNRLQKSKYSLKPQKPNKWRKTYFEKGAKYSKILFANEIIQVPAEKNVCTEFEENWLKFGTTRARVQDKPLNMCSWDPDRCSSRGSGPIPYRHSLQEHKTYFSLGNLAPKRDFRA